MSRIKKALITGILGQDGPYLAENLIEKGYHVYGMVRRYSHVNTQNLDRLGIRDRIVFVEADMTDQTSINKIFAEHDFDEVYNLAAQSFVGSSWAMPEYTFSTNTLGVLYLLEAIRTISPTTRLYQASTSEMFGRSHTDGRQSETTPFDPRSPYATAKVCAYYTTRNFRDNYGIFVCNGILFNHESPLRGDQFVTQKIATGAAMIHLGLAESLALGSLDSRRDWGFAGDYVQAMWAMMQRNEPDDYVIGTGESHSVQEFAEEAFNYLGIHNWRSYVVRDERFIRKNDVMDLVADTGKAQSVLGWEHRTTFKELVAMMVKSAVERLS